MCSDMNDCRLRQPGFPIRRSPDQSVFAAPRSLSQLTTSFIASYRQGIPLLPVTVCLPVSYNYLKDKLFTSRAVKCNYLFTRYDDELSKNEKIVAVISRPGRAFGSFPMVGPAGLEPATPALSTRCSNQLSYGPAMVEPDGVEPTTSCLQSRRSTN